MLANHLLRTTSFLLREYLHHHLLGIQEDLLTKMQSLSKKIHHCLGQFPTCLLCRASYSLNSGQIYNHQRICLLILFQRSVDISFLQSLLSFSMLSPPDFHLKEPHILFFLITFSWHCLAGSREFFQKYR